MSDSALRPNPADVGLQRTSTKKRFQFNPSTRTIVCPDCGKVRELRRLWNKTGRCHACASLLKVPKQVSKKGCTQCLIVKDRSQFSTRICRTGRGLQSMCKSCAKKYAEIRYPDRYIVNRDKILDKRRQKIYGITRDQFDQQLALQGDRCAICRIDKPSGNGTWHIDHDHATNALRGLLCSHCNMLLARAKESAIILQSAIGYLQKGGVWCQSL